MTPGASPTGAPTTFPSWLPRSFRVFGHRNFAIVQLGNGTSSLGTWMQYVALAWGIRQLSSWDFAVALSLVAQFAPSIVLSPIAGCIADRFDRRRVVIVGNLVMVVPPILIGVLVTLHHQTIPYLLGLAALGGCAQALTQPAMTSIVPHLVPGDEIAQAIAGASVIQNATRIIGPSLGALAINEFGLASAFYLNGLSFLAVVLAWSFVRLVEPARPPTADGFGRQILAFWAQIREGLQFAWASPQILQLLILVVVMSSLVFQSALLPILASSVLHSGAGGFGLLQSAGGPGAVIGAIVAGELITDRRRRLALIGGSFLMGGGYLVVSLSRSLWLSAGGVFLFGFTFFLVNAVSQTVLLTATPDRYRGRVMGLFSMVTVGGVPVAALVGGVLGSLIGPTEAIGVAAILVLVYTTWFVVSGSFRLIGIESTGTGSALTVNEVGIADPAPATVPPVTLAPATPAAAGSPALLAGDSPADL